MILLIDNYDSFVYNLARYVGKLGRGRHVVRHDAITIGEIETLRPEAIILSPGPKSPHDSGICMDVIEHFHQTIPILGVCLGHQCIGEAFGGRTVCANRPMHGKTSLIRHSGEGIFLGLPEPLEVARYHSLMTALPANTALDIVATVDGEDTIMALQHREYPVYGVQFHPESILTTYGLDLMRNFMNLADEWHEKRKEAA